jgi:1,2-phenylacetyl-CoA epoxidase catalytic subunit
MPFEDYAVMTGRIWLIDKWEDIFIKAYDQSAKGGSMPTPALHDKAVLA